LDGADKNNKVIESNKTVQWNDKSGNDRHFAEEFVENSPSIGMINGNETLFFNGNNNRLEAYNWGNDLFRDHDEFTVFHVVQFTDVGGNTSNILRAHTTSATSVRHRVGVEDFGYRRLNSDSFTNASYNLDPVVNDELIMTSHVSDFGNGTASVARNGVDFSQYTTLPIGNTSDTDSVIITIGAAGSSHTSQPLHGHICEIIVLKYIPSESLRHMIEGYLAHKWGLVDKLPTNHPYKNEPPTI